MLGQSNELASKTETKAEIESRINTSETAEVFKSFFLENFLIGSDWGNYLLKDTQYHSIHLEFDKRGVFVELLNSHPRYYKTNSTYVYNKEGIGFSASGYADLPNSSYVSAFKSYIFKALQENCGYLNVQDNGPIVVKYKESAKTGW